MEIISAALPALGAVSLPADRNCACIFPKVFTLNNGQWLPCRERHRRSAPL